MAVGYHDRKDSMRDNAEKAFGMKKKSAPAYKKGGPATGCDSKEAFEKKNGKGKRGWGGALGRGLGALAGGLLGGGLSAGTAALPAAAAGLELGGQIGDSLPFKKGGKVSKPSMKKHMEAMPKKACGGKMQKLAMGGAAKVRLNQATAEGKPIYPRKSR